MSKCDCHDPRVFGCGCHLPRPVYAPLGTEAAEDARVIDDDDPLPGDAVVAVQGPDPLAAWQRLMFRLMSEARSKVGT